MSAAAGATLQPVYNDRTRVLNFLCGKTQHAIEDLLRAIPLDDSYDISTLLLHDEARTKLIEALRYCQILYGATAPPVRPMSPCPCGCDRAEAIRVHTE